MGTEPESSAWTLDLPAGLLHVWPRGEAGEWEERLTALVESLGPASGVHRLDGHRLAVVPVAGDPAVLDAAASYGRLLAAAAQRARWPAAAPARRSW